MRWLLQGYLLLYHAGHTLSDITDLVFEVIAAASPGHILQGE